MEERGPRAGACVVRGFERSQGRGGWSPDSRGSKKSEAPCHVVGGVSCRRRGLTSSPSNYKTSTRSMEGTGRWSLTYGTSRSFAHKFHFLIGEQAALPSSEFPGLGAFKQGLRRLFRNATGGVPADTRHLLSDESLNFNVSCYWACGQGPSTLALRPVCGVGRLDSNPSPFSLLFLSGCRR